MPSRHAFSMRIFPEMRSRYIYVVMRHEYRDPFFHISMLSQNKMFHHDFLRFCLRERRVRGEKLLAQRMLVPFLLPTVLPVFLSTSR